MDHIFFQCAMLLWIAGILFYCVLFPIATQKCFCEKTTIRKNICHVIVCIFLMPMIVFEYSDCLSTVILSFLHIPASSIGAYILSAFCEIGFIILAVCLYALYFRPRNKNMAVFVYLMLYVLTSIPSTLPPMNAASDKSFQIFGESILILGLGCWFYRFLIVPVSKITQMEHIYGQKAYIVLPAFTLLYSLIIEKINAMYQENHVLLVVTAISSIFVILAVSIGFRYIIQNTVVINELEKARDDNKKLSVEVMEALAHTIDAKDEYTKGHSVRVANYSRMIAEEMGLSKEDCESIYNMALLHDIGKVGVPNEIINKPTKLTDEEYDIIKTHPVLGYDILTEIKSQPILSIGARWHHERCDGRGYPDGKKEEEIPYLVKIIAVADSYDAMTSNRSYRKYLPQATVRAELEKNMGTQFDPEVAKCMISIIDHDPEYLLHET